MSNLIGHLLLGMALGLGGVIPPGLLNMNAAKIAVNHGKTRGLMFGLGASLVVMLQSTVGLFFAKLLVRKTGLVIYLERFGLLIFVLLSIYFFWIAFSVPKSTRRRTVKSKRSMFWYGVILSALNVFPIPFYAFVSVNFADEYWFNFQKPFALAFVLGTSLGTFLMMYLYVLFAPKIASTGPVFVKRMNLFIGVVTGLVAFFTLIKVIGKL